MKKLIFKEYLLNEDIELASQFESLLFQYPYLNTFFTFKEISIKSNVANVRPFTQDSIYRKESENINNFLVFLVLYLFNILHNNGAAVQRKKPPYDVIIKAKICFKTKQFQYKLFIDDFIFGLVIGSKFKNVISLIQTLFPVSAKMDLSNEIRFFPISRNCPEIINRDTSLNLGNKLKK